jgi:hypothetical protein
MRRSGQNLGSGSAARLGVTIWRRCSASRFGARLGVTVRRRFGVTGATVRRHCSASTLGVRGSGSIDNGKAPRAEAGTRRSLGTPATQRLISGGAAFQRWVSSSQVPWRRILSLRAFPGTRNDLERAAAFPQNPRHTSNARAAGPREPAGCSVLRRAGVSERSRHPSC